MDRGNMGACRAGGQGSLHRSRTAVPGEAETGLGSYQALLGPDKGPVLPIHLVIEAAGIAQVVACPVPPPQWSGCCSAVHTLPGL